MAETAKKVVKTIKEAFAYESPQHRQLAYTLKSHVEALKEKAKEDPKNYKVPKFNMTMKFKDMQKLYEEIHAGKYGRL